jgi:two-component system, NtrC family, response regulator AtoC
MIRVLVVDDEKNFRRVIVQELQRQGFSVEEAAGGKEALERITREEFDVLILDLSMPGLGGMDLLRMVKELDNPLEVIILTAHGTITTAVEAMKLGAYDFLSKPFRMEELSAAVSKAYEKKELLRQNWLLRAQIARKAEPYRIITRNPQFLALLESVQKFSRSNLPVLISGESGVGKELIARAIHGASPRSSGPFIPINCGAIPENMLESELFGHEKGAFTGAHVRKPGLLEVAHEGVLFLDEVSEMIPTLQSKLLRAIETGSFFKVGGTRETTVDTRFLAATNRNLKEEVEKGRFRSDLFFRLSALTVSIPPLRERQEDIALLVEHFIQENPEFQKRRFSPEALKVMERYPWPGNVRELKNIVHRTLLLTEQEVVEPADLPPGLLVDQRPASKKLEDVEKEHILRVLKETGGRRGQAAEILGMDPKTLYRKMLSYGLRDDSEN